MGQQNQAQQQTNLDEQYARWLEARNYPLEQLNTRLAALGATPYSTSQSTTQSGGGGNPFLGMLGGASTGASIASALGASSGWGAGLTGAGAFLGLLSDDKEKKDIEKLGESAVPGVGIHAFRYKTDKPNSAKVVGLLASEVEKAAPDAVRRVGGKRIIDPEFQNKAVRGVVK